MKLAQKTITNIQHGSVYLKQHVLAYKKSEIACGIIDEHRKNLKYRHLIQKPETKQIWENSMSNEIGRLAQGRLSKNLPGMNTLQFILYKDIPQERKKDITYAKIVVNYCPQKKEPHRT